MAVWTEKRVREENILNMTGKKLISIMTVGLLAASLLTGCGLGKGENSTGNAAEEQGEQTAESGTGNTENTVEEAGTGDNGKILIAYFTAAENSGVDAVSSASYSTVNGEAVGRVRAVADMIQSETGGRAFFHSNLGGISGRWGRAD